MAGIQTSVGLISGMDYVSIVDQLIELDKVPAQNLVDRTKTLEEEQTALTELAALFMTTSYMIENLNKAATFNSVTMTSSDETVLTASKSGTASEGTYTFTPLQLAQSQQTVASGVAKDNVALGKTGEITIRHGADMQSILNYDLGNLNGGAGITKGYIRIIDGSGTRATIDLRNVTSINDVLKAINDNTEVDVVASVKEGSIVLTDLSGGTNDLIVQDISGGKTAASLGLLGSSDTGEIVGSDLVTVGTKTNLNFLNDGNGLALDKNSDLLVTRADGRSVIIDLVTTYSETTTDAKGNETTTTTYQYPKTMGDLLALINNAKVEQRDGNNDPVTDADGNVVMEDAMLRAYLSGDGKRIIIEDGTKTQSGATGSTTIEDTNGGSLLRSLGLDPYGSGKIQSDSGYYMSRELVGDFESVLTSSLAGGRGLTNSGLEMLAEHDKPCVIAIGDRSGVQGVINISQTELKENSSTLKDLMDLINGKIQALEVTDPGPPPTTNHVNIEVRMNQNNTGLEVVDLSGGSSAPLMFGDWPILFTANTGEGGAEEEHLVTEGLATALGINTITLKEDHTVDSMGEAEEVHKGKDLGFQTVSYNTKLADLNGGKGLTLAGGIIKIHLAGFNADQTRSLVIDSTKHQTVGDLIADLQSLYPSEMMRVSINEAGDGIMIEDLTVRSDTQGNGIFSISDGDGFSKIASELKLVGSVDADDENGRKIISGSNTYRVEIEEKDTLETIRKKINDLGGMFTAATLVDGTDTPYRLSITSKATGAASKMVIDLSALGLETMNLSEAQDAIVAYGDQTTGATLTLKSKTNSFQNAAPGVNITIKQATGKPVQVTSSKTGSEIKTSLTAFTENYNKFHEKYVEYTKYGEDGSRNLLSGNNTALALQRELDSILHKSFSDLGSIRSLQELGLTFSKVAIDDNGDPVPNTGGTLSFDETVFDTLYRTDPDAIEEFFYKQKKTYDFEKQEYTTVSDGFAARFKKTSDMLTAQSGSVMAAQFDKYKTQISNNYTRAAEMIERLATKRTRLLKQFYAMEQNLAKIQNNVQYIEKIGQTGSGTTG